MRNNMAHESNFDNEEFDHSESTIVTNNDTKMNELDLN